MAVILNAVAHIDQYRIDTAGRQKIDDLLPGGFIGIEEISVYGALVVPPAVGDRIVLMPHIGAKME